MTMQSFNPDKVLKTLADFGVKPRGDARAPAGPMVSYVSTRMEDRGGAKGGTPELYFTDPDGIVMQLQDVSYCGGGGSLWGGWPFVFLRGARSGRPPGRGERAGSR